RRIQKLIHDAILISGRELAGDVGTREAGASLIARAANHAVFSCAPSQQSVAVASCPNCLNACCQAEEDSQCQCHGLSGQVAGREHSGILGKTGRLNSATVAEDAQMSMTVLPTGYVYPAFSVKAELRARTAQVMVVPRARADRPPVCVQPNTSALPAAALGCWSVRRGLSSMLTGSI